MDSITKSNKEIEKALKINHKHILRQARSMGIMKMSDKRLQKTSSLILKDYWLLQECYRAMVRAIEETEV